MPQHHDLPRLIPPVTAEHNITGRRIQSSADTITRFVVCSMATMDLDTYGAVEPQPSVFRWIIGFLMVGACWGLTTPFMRRAAMYYSP
jgi:hypothetical protein